MFFAAKRLRRFSWWYLAAVVSLGLAIAWVRVSPGHRIERASDDRSLSFMSLEAEKDDRFEKDVFGRFSQRERLAVHLAQWPQATTSSRLAIYRQLFRSHSPQPDLVEIDVVWPGVLADDLIDLKPYLGGELTAFAPDLISDYTVQGRLVALPVVVDMGVLYCRRDLLHKYGFRAPPKTWNELETMASAIQAGERREGNRNFWGYVWQGHTHEALTCNALEWQASAGAGTIVEADGRVNVSNAKMIKVLKRGLGWIGTISPPGENSYWESDSLNLWQAGNAAFMRMWASSYGLVDKPVDSQRYPFEIAPIPAGENGHKGTLGGIGIGVSRYSKNKFLAVAALRFLTSEAMQTERALAVATIPTRIALRDRADLMAHTALGGSAGRQVLASRVARPSGVSGKSYDLVSQAYLQAVHSALTRKESPEAAMARLQAELVYITGSK